MMLDVLKQIFIFTLLSFLEHKNTFSISRFLIIFFSFFSLLSSIFTHLRECVFVRTSLMSVHRKNIKIKRLFFSFGWGGCEFIGVCMCVCDWVHDQLDVSHMKANFIQFELFCVYSSILLSFSLCCMICCGLEGHEKKAKNHETVFLA